MVFRRVTEGVYMIRGHPDSNVNVTALTSPDRVIMVDCGMPLGAMVETRRRVEEYFKSKVKMVILTHFHSDHTNGLLAFGDCRIISADSMVKNLKQAGRKVPEGYKPVFPNETFKDQLEVQEGDLQLVVKRTGGHTDGSTYIYCPEYRVLAVGDNLTIGYNPWGGARNGDPDAWIKALHEYLSLNVKFIIPGHGPVGNKDNAMELLDYINNVRKVMREMISSGRVDEEILKASNKIEYIPSRIAHPSTLKRWLKVWRERSK